MSREPDREAMDVPAILFLMAISIITLSITFELIILWGKDLK